MPGDEGCGNASGISGHIGILNITLRRFHLFLNPVVQAVEFCRFHYNGLGFDQLSVGIRDFLRGVVLTWRRYAAAGVGRRIERKFLRRRRAAGSVALDFAFGCKEQIQEEKA